MNKNPGMPVHDAELVRVQEHLHNRVLALEPEFSWEQAVRVLRKNRNFAVALAGGLTFLILVVSLTIKDSYQPVARLDIEPPSSGIKTLHEIESATDFENQDYLETQVQILKSDALAVSVIRDLKLDRESSTMPGANVPSLTPGSDKPAVPDSAAFLTGSYLREQFELASLSPAESRALDRFHKSLSVNTVHNTRLVEVSYASPDTLQAQRITNAVVSRFIDNGYKQRYATTMQMSAWLSSQLSELRRRLEASNQAVSDYQKRYGLVELDDRDVPMSQLMGEVNHQLSEAQANRIEAEAFVRMIKFGQADAIPMVRDDQVYQNLTLRYADLRAQLEQAKTVYGDANANVKKLEAQTAEIAHQINAERARINDRLRTSFAAATERESLMMRNREKLRQQMGAVNSQLVGYHLLKNDAQANAELYNTLQGRLQEAGIYAGLKASNIRVVDLATNLQKATTPNRPLLVASGGFLSCLLALFACFVKESLNNTVRTPDDVKSWVGLRSLALLPVMRSEGPAGRTLKSSISEWLHPKVYVIDQSEASTHALMKPMSAASEAVRDLRTALLSSRAQNVPHLILISSSMEGEGKTTVATNLAVALSQIGRTCLVDGDLRRPTVTRSFGIIATRGLSDVLRGTLNLSEALVSVTETSNLWILPGGEAVESPADVLASLQIDKLCAELRRIFDYVVIDSPPVIRFSDARFLSQLADEVVLVGRYGVSTRRAMQRSVELLREVEAPIAGVVLNAIDLSSPDYHYFTYGYSKGIDRQTGKKFEVPPSSPFGSADTQQEKSKSAHA